MTVVAPQPPSGEATVAESGADVTVVLKAGTPAPRTPAGEETVRIELGEPTVRIPAGPPAGPRRWWPPRGETLLVSVLLLLVALVQGWNILDYPQISDDEGTYLAQGWAVATGKGLAHYT